jgi:hypothetical protein
MTTLDGMVDTMSRIWHRVAAGIIPPILKHYVLGYSGSFNVTAKAVLFNG